MVFSIFIIGFTWLSCHELCQPQAKKTAIESSKSQIDFVQMNFKLQNEFFETRKQLQQFINLHACPAECVLNIFGDYKKMRSQR
jgi:hypothetical protein